MKALLCPSSTSSLLFTAAFTSFVTILFYTYHRDALPRLATLPHSSRPQHLIQDIPASHLRRYTAEKCDSHILFDAQHKPCHDMPDIVSTQRMYATRTADTNLLACVPPKNACTVHKSLLQRTRGVREYESNANVHGAGSATLRLESWTNEDIAQAFLNLSMPKYAIVKNPFTRTLSAYLGKVEKIAPEDQRTVEHFKKWAYEEFPKGSGHTKDWSRVNPHWRPQANFCGFRAFNLHEHFHMFRFEQPDTFVDFIYEHIPARYLDTGWGSRIRINVSFSEYVLSPAVRDVRGSKSADKKYEYFRDLELFDHMAEELRDDIILLGYEDDIRKFREEIVELNGYGKSGKVRKIKTVVRSFMTRGIKFADSLAKRYAFSGST